MIPRKTDDTVSQSQDARTTETVLGGEPDRTEGGAKVRLDELATEGMKTRKGPTWGPKESGGRPKGAQHGDTETKEVDESE